jgi:hypothetical protein
LFRGSRPVVDHLENVRRIEGHFTLEPRRLHGGGGAEHIQEVATRRVGVTSSRAQHRPDHTCLSLRDRILSLSKPAAPSSVNNTQPAQQGVGSRSKYPPRVPPACTRYPNERFKPALPPTSDGS